MFLYSPVGRADGAIIGSDSSTREAGAAEPAAGATAAARTARVAVAIERGRKQGAGEGEREGGGAR